MKKSLLLLLFALTGYSAMAQFPPREDDHFWRRKVLSRIDLQEKVNKPLIQQESNLYVKGKGKFGNTKGMINALISGLRDLKYPAYRPDTLYKPMTYDELVAVMQGIQGASSGESVDLSSSAGSEGGEEGGDELGGDDFGGDDFGGDEDFAADEGGGEEEAGGSDAQAVNEEIFTGLDAVMEVIEDRIFDKNKSDMYYDVQFIRFVWIDPLNQLPDKNIIAFKYTDVMDILDQTQWKNFWNDAEYRSMREIIELRLHHSFVIDLSGNPMRSLDEAEKRRQQMIEFEHHLWEF